MLEKVLYEGNPTHVENLHGRTGNLARADHYLRNFICENVLRGRKHHSPDDLPATTSLALLWWEASIQYRDR